VFGKQHGGASTKEAGQRRIEKGRVLVGVDQADMLLSAQTREPPRQSPVQAGLPLQHPDGKAFFAKFMAKSAQLVQADKQKPIRVGQLPRQPSGQYLGPANPEAMQKLTNSGAAPAKRSPLTI
jgi:hypothetical protein